MISARKRPAFLRVISTSFVVESANWQETLTKYKYIVTYNNFIQSLLRYFSSFRLWPELLSLESAR